MAPATATATATGTANGNFPRGRKKPIASSVLASTDVSQSTKKRKHHDANVSSAAEEESSDVLFGKKAVAMTKEKDAAKSEKRQKKKHKKSAPVEDKKEPETKEKESAAVVAFKTLAKGTLLLGCVRQINENDLVVSLPNKLNGIVSKEHCGDQFFEWFQQQKQKQQQQAKRLQPQQQEDDDQQEELPALDDIFSVGQFVPCVVLECAKAQKHKTIHLSLRLSLLHSEFTPASIQKAMALHGTVSSLEDHGAIVNLGVRGLHAFVPQKELKGITLHVGQQKLFVVDAMNTHTSTATLSCDTAQTVKSVTRGDAFTLKTLVPGMLLNIRVDNVLSNGLAVNFLSFFRGTVEQNHMSFPGCSDWQEKFRKGMKGRARIISINRVTKSVTLSMAPQVVHLSAPNLEHLSVGDIVEDAQVERIDTGIGMLLSLPKVSCSKDQDQDQDKGTWKSFCAAYVHISNCDDSHVDKLEKKFKLGQKVTSRVIGFAPFDALVNVTLKSSSLAQKVLRHADLQPGEKVSQCKILAVEKWGLLVELSEGVRGLVTAQHVPFFKKMKAKYKAGQKVDVRVLQVDLVNKKTFLTMKKALLQSTLPPLASYEQAATTSGTVAQGFVTKIADYGLVVSFYNGVYGLVPAALLRQAGIEDIAEAYEIGQVVKVAVTRCDLAKKRLILTLDTTKALLNATSNGKTKATGASKSSAAVLESGNALIGQRVRGVKILEKESTFLRVQTRDGLEGVLPFSQLTDTPRAQLCGSAVEQFASKYQVNDVMQEELLVLSQTKDGVLNLSMKPLLLLAAQASKSATFVLPDSLEAVEHEQKHANRPLVGFVASVHATHGVFVRFLNDLTALAPKGLLTERFLSSSEGLFEVGDTVRCVVDKIVADKRQLLVSLKKNPLGNNKADAAFFQSLVHTNTKWAANDGNALPPYKSVKVGSSVKAEFVDLRPYGAVFTLKDDDQVTVLVASDHCGQADQKSWAKAGKVTKLLLVDYDFSKKIFYGVVNDDQLVASGTKKQQKLRSRLSIGQDIMNVRVVALPTHHQFAIASFADPTKPDVLHLCVVQLADFWCPYQTADQLELTLDSVVTKCRVASTPSSTEDDDTPFSALPVLTIADDKAAHKSSSSFKAKPTDEVTLPKYSEIDLAVGKKVTGVIVGIKEDSMEIKVRVGKKVGKVVAAVSIVDVDFDEDNGSNAKHHPLDQFSVNTKVTGVILGMIVKGANQRKPVSDSNPPVFRWLTLSLKQKEVEGDDKRALYRVDWDGVGLEQLVEGKSKRLRGIVVENSKQGVLVRLSHRVTGFCHCLELTRDLEVLKNFAKHFPVGKTVQTYVLDVDEENKRVDLSLVRSANDELPLQPGTQVVGMINTKVKAIRPPCAMVELASHTFGRVCITEMVVEREWSDKLLEKPEFAHAKFVAGVVLPSKHTGAVELSLRSDALANPNAYADQAAQRESRAIAVGDLMQGFVASTTTRGCFVRLDAATVARVLLRDLSDDFVKNPVEDFPVGKLVAGRVTKVVDATESQERKIELSLKASVVAEDAAVLRWSDLKEGACVKGTVTRVQPYGVFVKIDNSNISGLCHISEIADERIEKPLDQVFSEGDYVKAKILKIEDRRVSFGLKPSYFDGEEDSSSEEEEDNDNGSSSDEEQETNAQVEAMDVDQDGSSGSDESDDDDDEDENENGSSAMEVDEPAAVEFAWDGFKNVMDHKKSSSAQDDDSSDDEDEDDDDDNQVEASKKSTKKAKKHKDEWIALREKALASGDATPQTADDFERLVAASPNSSYLWIQYMAFHVAMTEIQLARDVAIRATSAVSYRDENEKLNVWVAYLNLEHDFGDANSFSRVFKSALQVNSPKAVYLQLVDLYARAGEADDASTTVDTMLKKFKSSKKVWLRAIQWQLEQCAWDEAAATLQRSLKSLSSHKHLVVITKYGQMLYEKQQLDKARTIFEGVLANYPKRVDLWNVYLDKEIKFADAESARRLFERVVSLDFSAKKMKFLFKKFVQFEQTHGDAARVEHVKQLAREFVANSASS